jgi:hypothetical protein
MTQRCGSWNGTSHLCDDPQGPAEWLGGQYRGLQPGSVSSCVTRKVWLSRKGGRGRAYWAAGAEATSRLEVLLRWQAAVALSAGGYTLHSEIGWSVGFCKML